MGSHINLGTNYVTGNTDLRSLWRYLTRNENPTIATGRVPPVRTLTLSMAKFLWQIAVWRRRTWKIPLKGVSLVVSSSYITHAPCTLYPKKYAHGCCFAVFCCGYTLTVFFPYPSGLLHWHWGNLTIAPVPAEQAWWIWINTSCEFIMNDCITTTKQSTTKPCAYFLGYTVCPSNPTCIQDVDYPCWFGLSLGFCLNNKYSYIREG